jgi:DNA-binding MarR family transcriptional regulator
MVERLVGKGILSREHSTEDRRKVLVTISPHAIKRAEAIEASLLQFFVELVDKIGPETSQMWCDVLARIKSVLNQEAPSRAETPDR